MVTKRWSKSRFMFRHQLQNIEQKKCINKAAANLGKFCLKIVSKKKPATKDKESFFIMAGPTANQICHVFGLFLQSFLAFFLLMMKYQSLALGVFSGLSACRSRAFDNWSSLCGE